jgi:DNA-binding transcriptional ArsR family regulator
MSTVNLDAMLAALADPARRRTIELLQSSPRRSGELAQELRVSASRMSQHLRVLRSSGLIEDNGVEHDARVKLYRLRPQPFAALRSWVEEVEAFWQGQLAAFKAHADSAAGRARELRGGAAGAKRTGATRATPRRASARAPER